MFRCYVYSTKKLPKDLYDQPESTTVELVKNYLRTRVLIILTRSLWLNCEERRSTWPSRRHIEGDSAAAIRIGLLHIAVLKSYTKPLHELTTAFSPAIIKIWVQSIEYTSIAIANSVKPYSSSAIYIYKRCVVRYPKNVLLTGWCIHTDTKYSFH